MRSVKYHQLFLYFEEFLAKVKSLTIASLSLDANQVNLEEAGVEFRPNLMIVRP